jgi:Fe-S-cluster containining protein
MNIRRQIELTEKKAHQGEYGSWRRAFCRSYREVTGRICRQAAREQKEYLDSTGASISCGRGCAHCCSQYISISLAHGLAIVDYLYFNHALIDPFLNRYSKWLQAMAGSEPLQALERYTNQSKKVKRTPQELLDTYARQNVPCPFLRNSLCTIYPVRPICCASHISISPPELCRADSADPPMISEATPSHEDLLELAMLGEPVLSLHQETLPSLVFRLLTEGFPEVRRKVEDIPESSVNLT